MALTHKQELFVKEYLVDLNATQAAIRAGYSEKTAKDIGCQNLAKLDIAEAIQEAFNARAKRVEITADRVLLEIARSAFVDPAEYFSSNGSLLEIHAMPEETRRSISGVKVRKERSGEYDDDGKPLMDTITEIKVNDKTRNLELLGKHLKLFSDRLEIETIRPEDIGTAFDAALAHFEDTEGSTE